MDDAVIVVFVAGAILFAIVRYMTEEPSAFPTSKESTDNATIETCSKCHSILGISTRDKISVQLSNKNKCPHCGARIRRK